jgi:hypothetical protein
MKKPKSMPALPNAPATITAEQLAGLCNLTKRRLYQLADEHKIPQPTNGCFPMLETITAMFSYYQRDGADLQREKLLKTAAERKLRELELGVSEGKLTNARIAQQTMNAALKKYHGIVRTQLEKLDIKDIQDFHASLGLSDEQKAALHGFHLQLARATIDKVEDVCEAIGRGEEPVQS